VGGSWLDLQNVEYLASRPNATRFATYIEGRAPLLVSAIEIHEVYRVIRRDLSEERAVEAGLRDGPALRGDAGDR
jgi:hypothetical protein